MNTLPRRRGKVQRTADAWPDSVDDFRWELGPEPTDDDKRWHAQHNEEWHDLDGHLTIDDETIADEAVYREEEARRFAADPTDEEINRWADERAAESEFLDQHEAGLSMF